MSEKNKLLEYINTPQEESHARNRMGCLESWYDPYYAISNTFNKDTIESMTESEVDNLIKLASTIGEALY